MAEPWVLLYCWPVASTHGSATKPHAADGRKLHGGLAVVRNIGHESTRCLWVNSNLPTNGW